MTTMTPGPSASPRDVRWDVLLGEIAATRMTLERVDPVGSPLTIPQLAATREQLAEAEARLNHPLDPVHRDLLRFANGWEDLFVYSTLLSTDQLGAGDLWTQAQQRLGWWYDEWPEDAAPPLAEVEPIMVSSTQEDTFVLWRGGPETGGGRPVLWLAGEVVQEWPNVYEFMLSVNSYTRRMLEKALREPVPPPA